MDCHEAGAWIKTKDLLIESSSANGKCSMITLAGGIIPVVTEKYELDYRDMSVILNIFHFFPTIAFMMERSQKLVFHSIQPSQKSGFRLGP